MGYSRDNRDSGQVIPLVAYLMVPILLLVALAIDFGSFYLRANELQTASDLAALAGAEALADGSSGTEVRALVETILEANGIDTEENTVNTVIAGSTVSVSVEDPDTTQFISQFVTDDVAVARDATATAGNCEGCGTEIEIQSTEVDLPQVGQGDGYRPIVIEDNNELKIYALNHHVGSLNSHANAPNMICVSMSTKNFCPGFPKKVTGATGMKPVITSTPGKIWYASHTSNTGNGRTKYGFGCMLYDGNPCTGDGHIQLSNRNGGIKYRYGWTSNDIGTYISDPAVYGDKVFAVDFKGRAYCRDANTLNECWPRQQPSEWDYTKQNNWLKLSGSSWPNDTQPTIESIVSNNKLYTFWYMQNPDIYTFDILCFDMVTEAPCSGFARTQQWGWINTVFPHHVNGQENGVCYLRQTTSRKMKCITEDGSTSDMPGLALAIDALDGVDGRFPVGVLTQAERDGDTLILAKQDWGNWSNSETHCIIIQGDGGTPCANAARNDPGVPYAYAKVPGVDCFITMGHTAEFDFFSPELEDCDPGINRFWVSACDCNNGEFRWGTVSFGNDFGTYLESLIVTVETADGTVIFGPVDILNTDGEIDLSGLVSDNETGLWLRMQANEKAGFNWEIPLTADVDVIERAGLIN